MNTMLSYLKYGINACYEGFGYGSSWNCNIGNSPSNNGNNTYSTDVAFSAKDIVDDLATLLTSGRLSESSRLMIEQYYNETIGQGKSEMEAIINVQQLIATTPEFHTNGLSHKTGQNRVEPTNPAPTSEPYKAVVYVMLSGGYDSYNMLVPQDCNGTNAAGQNVRDQYDEQRGVMAFGEGNGERDLTIVASNQPCKSFAIHDELKIVKELYDDGHLLFFANTGVINSNGMTKSNYNGLTKTQLFAHDAMQEESKKVDPFDNAPGTGVLGRAKDVLSSKGHVVNSLSIDHSSIVLEGAPGVSSPTTIVGRNGVKTFAEKPGGEAYFNIETYAKQLNAENDEHSNIYGETWSQQFATGIEEGKSLANDLSLANLTKTIWYDDDEKPLADGGIEQEHWQKWSTIFKLMQTHENRNVDRDIFYTEFGGWDHHSSMKVRIGLYPYSPPLVLVSLSYHVVSFFW